MTKDRHVFQNDGSNEPHITHRRQLEETQGRDRRKSNPAGRLREREPRSQREREREREQGYNKAANRTVLKSSHGCPD